MQRNRNSQISCNFAPSMTYEETLQYLYNSQPAFHLVGAAAYKPGLDNTIRLTAHLKNPHLAFPSIHIAGTNGKGSTSHLIAATLQAAGYKTGLYTSPHLVDFRERIRINGKMIEEEDVVGFVEKHRRFLEQLKPSFFETTMAMAFDYFATEQVDVAVIETGLGGRLDSTNIITPLLSVITNIGFDHTEFLGSTLPKIAAEKAGIIKQGVPVVIGETDPETAPVFIKKAAEMQSPIVFADQQQRYPADMVCQLQGYYQQKNHQTAYTALQQLSSHFRIEDNALQQGFAHVCDMTGLQGRWQVLCQQPFIVCDTGHNSHGIRYVAEQIKALSAQCGHIHIVFGMVSDKDVDAVLSLLPLNAIYYFTQAATHRAIPAQQLLETAKKHHLAGKAFRSVKEAVDSARNSLSVNDFLYIGGSNYIVGEALPLF